MVLLFLNKRYRGGHSGGKWGYYFVFDGQSTIPSEHLTISKGFQSMLNHSVSQRGVWVLFGHPVLNLDTLFYHLHKSVL